MRSRKTSVIAWRSDVGGQRSVARCAAIRASIAAVRTSLVGTARLTALPTIASWRTLVSVAALFVALSSLGGCARNGVLEVELTLPAHPGSGAPLYAVIEVIAGDHDFETASIDREYPGTLLTGAPQQLYLSLLTEQPSGHVRLVVYFCPNTTCAGVDARLAPQVWFEFEQATFIGRRTRWSGEIATVPTGAPAEARCVDRCEIEGCIDGQGRFCREDGTHYCQDRGSDPGVEVCEP